MQSLNSALARRPQPLWEIAYNPEDIKARLSGVPVYTVANKNNEFVLVTGEVCFCIPVFQQLSAPCM